MRHVLFSVGLRVLVFAFSSFAATAQAQKFSVGVATELPVGMNLEASLAIPEWSVYFKARYGLTLKPYTELLNSTAESLDFYNSATGDIISESLDQAKYWELSLGWSQENSLGWFAEGGYFSIAGKGQITGSTLVAALSGITLPGGTNLYDIEGEVQALSARAGYRWPFGANLRLGISGGVLKPLDSQTQIDRDVSGPVQAAILAAANRELDEYLSDILKNDVWIPLIAASLQYQFE